jgi:RimJ/RimL family protein N-acetyltransferase
MQGKPLHGQWTFFKRVGYINSLDQLLCEPGRLIGGSQPRFKGAPHNGTVEIAYGTFEPYRKQGIATVICKLLVELSLRTDPSVKITARTLPEHNFSTKVLQKNGFECSGIVNDPEDGDVWEWVYKATEQ